MWNKEDFNGSDWEVLAWQKLSKKGNEVYLSSELKNVRLKRFVHHCRVEKNTVTMFEEEWHLQKQIFVYIIVLLS